jgi:hypothetical protein
MAIPALTLDDVPAHLATRQWAKVYAIGAATAPPFAVVTATSLAYLAARSYTSSRPLAAQSPRFYLYAAATLLLPGIMPFTLIAMRVTNGELKRLAKGREEEVLMWVGKEGVVRLLQVWKRLNLVRAAFPGLGALCAGVAVIWY